MTAVQMPAPLSSSAHTSPPQFPPLPPPSSPKRERNTPDNMLNDFHPLQPLSLPQTSSAQHSSFTHQSPLNHTHYPSFQRSPSTLHPPQPADPHNHNSNSISLHSHHNPHNSIQLPPTSQSLNLPNLTQKSPQHNPSIAQSDPSHKQSHHQHQTSLVPDSSQSASPSHTIPTSSPHLPIPLQSHHHSQPLLTVHSSHNHSAQHLPNLHNHATSSFNLPHTSQPTHPQHPQQHFHHQSSQQAHLPHLQHPQHHHHHHLPTTLPQSLPLPSPTHSHLLSASQPLSQHLPLPFPHQHNPANVQQSQHHHHNPVLLPALSQSHFKQADEVDVSDDLIGFGGLPTSRPQDMPGALVSSAFPPDPLPASQDQAVMDALLPHEPEQDPLNITASLHVPLHMDSQRSIERQVLATAEPDPVLRPSLVSQNNNLINPNSSTVQTPPQPFSLHVPQSVAHLSYGAQPTGVAHPQVLMQGQNSVSAFQLPIPQKQPLEGPPLLMLGKNGLRNASQANSLLQLSPQEEMQRKGSVTPNQMRIQDLTKTKSDAAIGDSQFSQASPSYSAVTVSPPTILQAADASPSSVGTPLLNVSPSGGESPTSITAPQGLSCQICKTVFTRRYNLKVHMTSKHSARRDYQCNQCSNAFNRGDSLKRHIATTHNGEKKWSCPYCKRNFGQRPHMKMHVDTVHLKKRDHKCHCGKAFGTRYNLTAHQRTHQQTPKKHLCIVCKKSFALKSSLARHQRSAAHTNPEVIELPRTQN